MTVMELLNECITELGGIRPSVDEQETIALPVHQVKNKQTALKNHLEQQAQKQEETHEEAEEEV